MNYQMINLDLDGTLLNSRKEIPEDTVQAIRTVIAAGKTVAFNTGRALPELADQIARLPEIRYAVYASGTGLYDTLEKKTFGLHTLPAGQVERICAVARSRDIMPQFVTADRIFIQTSHMENLEHFHMGVYRPMYEQAMTLVPDIQAFAETCREPFLKINLYHANPEERIQSRAQLETPELELTYCEISSLECAPAGVTKGSGLKNLCALLGIPAEACIAAGDGENDVPMFRAAGLSVAMGSAPAYIKAITDRVVPDQDHGGCAQAVLMLLE